MEVKMHFFYLLLISIFLTLSTAFAQGSEGQRQPAHPYGSQILPAEKTAVSFPDLTVLAKSSGGKQILAPINDAADWLLGQQDSSGAFPWTVGDPTLYSNVQGPSGRGMLAAYNQTQDPTYLNSAIANGDYLVPNYPRTYATDGDPRFATHDPLFLEELSIVTGDTKYADFLQTYFWDKLANGTYGLNDDQDAAAWAQSVVDSRAGSGIVEMAPWDLGSTVAAAWRAGDSTAWTAFMAGIQAALDSTTATDTDYDLHGLGGAIWGSGVTGIDLDPTQGKWAGANSTADLVDSLVQYIAPNGGWVYNTTAAVTDANADLQVTAFAILALKAYSDRYNLTTWDTVIADAINFVYSLQTVNGQFLIYPGASPTAGGGVEVHSEGMQAIGSNDDSLIPVELMSFSAHSREGLVVLRWATATETENLGFNIYRSVQKNGDFERINETVIRGAGTSAREQRYEYIDTAVSAGQTYFYKLADVDYNGNLTFHGPVSITVDVLPEKMSLEQNFPNPFNPSTTIRYELAKSGAVQLSIFNLAGQEIRRLVSGVQEAGAHAVVWDGLDDNGIQAASGVYIYRLISQGQRTEKKLILTR